MFEKDGNRFNEMEKDADNLERWEKLKRLSEIGRYKK